MFEGNSKVSDKDLTKEVQLKPRTVFTRAKVQADVQRIIELYRRNGKFAARVDPQIIQRPQNRVDLIFSITDGPTTGVAASASSAITGPCLEDRQDRVFRRRADGDQSRARGVLRAGSLPAPVPGPPWGP